MRLRNILAATLLFGAVQAQAQFGGFWVGNQQDSLYPTGVLVRYELSEYTNASGQIVDSSGNGWYAVPQTGAAEPSWSSSNGGYLSYDGGDWANTTVAPTLPTSNLTASAWVRFDTTNHATESLFQISLAGAVGDGWQITRAKNAAIGTNVYLRGIVYTDVGHYASFGPPFIPLLSNTWYHVAMTYDGVTKTVYCDGVEANSESATGDITWFAGHTNLVMGANRYDTGGVYMEGDGTEYAYWLRSLSSNEVLNLYNETKTRFGL
jgi:hypothetical protein